MKKIRLVFWDGVVNHSCVVNIYEWEPIILKDGKFDKQTQDCFNEALMWEYKVSIEKVK